MEKLQLKIKLINACLPEHNERINPLLEKRASQLVVAKAKAYELIAAQEQPPIIDIVSPWIEYNYTV